MDFRNQIRSYIMREGVTMTSIVELLAQKHGWSRSVSNLSAKLSRGTLKYREMMVCSGMIQQLGRGF